MIAYNSEGAKDKIDEKKEYLKKLRIKIRIIRGKNTTYEIVKPSDDRDELKENTLSRENTKKRKREETKPEENKSKLRATEVFSDDPYSEIPKHESKSPSKSSPKKEEAKEKIHVPTKLELNLIRLSKDNLEKIIDMPSFDKIATGCIIKIGVGQYEHEAI